VLTGWYGADTKFFSLETVKNTTKQAEQAVLVGLQQAMLIAQMHTQQKV